MKRAFDALANVAIAAAFVAFVEFYCRRRGRPDRLLRGLGKDHAPLLFEMEENRVLIATTKLSNFVTARVGRGDSQIREPPPLLRGSVGHSSRTLAARARSGAGCLS